MASIEYFKSPIVLQQATKVINFISENFWNSHISGLKSETYSLMANDFMTSVEISANVLNSIYEMCQIKKSSMHKKSHIDKSKPRDFSDVQPSCIEAYIDNTQLVSHNKIKVDEVSNQIRPLHKLPSTQSNYLQNLSNGKMCLNITNEKCRHIPALEFKDMWLTHFQKLKESSEQFTSASSFDVVAHKLMLTVAGSKSWRRKNDMNSKRQDNEAEITASVFSLIPNVNFEYFKIHNTSVSQKITLQNENKSDIGYITQKNGKIDPLIQ